MLQSSETETLFVGAGHLVVTDHLNNVKGIITRADLIHHQH